MGRRGQKNRPKQRIGHRRLPRPDANDAKTGRNGGQDFRPARRGRAYTADSPLQGFNADCHSDRPADLALARNRQRLRHHHQGTDSRGVRRRHHERDRLLHGHTAPARSERRLGACRTVGQVPALQDVLKPDAVWSRRFDSARMGGQPLGHCSSRGDCMPQMLFSYHSFPEAL